MNKLGLAVFQIGIGLLVCGTAFASGPDGVLRATSGEVLMQRGANTESVFADEFLRQGDTIITGDTGQVLWDMSDGSQFAMASNSGLKIRQYAEPDAANPAGRAEYQLINGAFHTITGHIGEKSASAAPERGHLMNAAMRMPRNPTYLIPTASLAPAKLVAYLVKTASATLTTQKADYAAAQAGKALSVKVNAGSVTACNSGGCTTAGAGQTINVTCATCAPSNGGAPLVPGVDVASVLQISVGGASVVQSQIQLSAPPGAASSPPIVPPPTPPIVPPLPPPLGPPGTPPPTPVSPN
ncbi:MAG: hypothetical protein ACRETW_06945 [Stenotrophobium sp.]